MWLWRRGNGHWLRWNFWNSKTGSFCICSLRRVAWWNAFFQNSDTEKIKNTSRRKHDSNSVNVTYSSCYFWFCVCQVNRHGTWSWFPVFPFAHHLLLLRGIFEKTEEVVDLHPFVFVLQELDLVLCVFVSVLCVSVHAMETHICFLNVVPWGAFKKWIIFGYNTSELSLQMSAINWLKSKNFQIKYLIIFRK